MDRASSFCLFFFFQAEDGIRDYKVTGVQTCALPILFALLGNDDYLLRQIAAGEGARARDYAAWVVSAAGGDAIKIVNPGGVERWKAGGRNGTGPDDAVGTGAVPPRPNPETLAGAAHPAEPPH